MKTLYALAIRHLVFVGDGYADTNDKTIRVVDRIDEEGQLHCLINEFHPFTDESVCKEIVAVNGAHHQIYSTEYPDGYQVEWLGCFDTEHKATEATMCKLTGTALCQQ